VGNGNNDVGRRTRKTEPNVQMSGGSSEKRIDRQMQAAQPQNCGAMSQQGSFSFHGNQAAPQKLVQLVGCRDPEVVAETWVRPGSVGR
jgi:hypothetical protein